MVFSKRLFALFFLLTLGTGMTLSSGVYAEDDADLPPVTLVHANNLHNDGIQAQQRHVPILLMFAQDGCSWCHYVEEEQLKPMLRNADYRAKVIIRMVMLDDLGNITDFDGRQTDSNSLAIRYNASLTPTIVFVDEHGKQLAKNIVGVRNTDFYGGDLDDGLAQSAEMIHQQLAALNLK